jgi:hypothetical protein
LDVGTSFGPHYDLAILQSDYEEIVLVLDKATFTGTEAYCKYADLRVFEQQLVMGVGCHVNGVLGRGQ